MNKVGIYLRLSNEDKDKQKPEERSESIKNQRNMLIDYINKHQEFTLVEEYCDEDLSGAGTYRPEFERLIKDCQNKKIDIVLCKSQSRFSRDMEIVEKYINNKFKEWNIRFISLSDNADTENTGNKKSRQINGLVNEWFLEDVSNNIRSAFNSKMKQGEFISPFASFGYEISKENNNKLIIDPFASEIVKEIYNLYLKGFGYTKIAKHLNNQNIPSPSLYKYKKGSKLNIVSNKPREEIKWNPIAIKTILTNELYQGHLVQGKRTTISYKNHKIINKNKDKWIKKENTHEAIIDNETFQKVQIAIKERTKPLKKTNTTHNFSGKVFCKVCNNYMRKKNSSHHQYLTCTNNNCQNKTSIRYDHLENLILNAINTKINNFLDLATLQQEIEKIETNSLNQKINSLIKQKNELTNQIAKTKNYLKNLYEDKVNQTITIEQFKELNTSYLKEENNYKEQIKTIEKTLNTYQVKPANKILSKYQKLKKLNRTIIEEFIDKIYIDKIDEKSTRNIYIKWNLK